MLVAPPAQSEVVSIDGGQGHGFLFHYGQECLVVLPAHVLGNRTSFILEGADPAIRGRGFISLQRIDELDLSVATVRAKGEMPCGPGWFDLAKHAADRIGAEVSLVRIEAQGYSNRTPMAVTEEGQTRFKARISMGFRDNRIFQGTSGSTAFVSGWPVGMAIEATNETDVEFLRFSRIIDAIARAKRLPMSRPAKIELDPRFQPVGTVVPKETAASPGNATVYSVDTPAIKPVTIQGTNTE